MNFFSSDAFLTSLAETYAPGRPFRIGLYRTERRVYRLVDIGHGPITQWDFMDSVDALEPPPDAEVRELAYLPYAVLGSVELGQAPEPVEERGGIFPAPYIDWSRFSGWPEFQDHFSKRRRSLLRDSCQKRRHLEQDLGPLCFVGHDTRASVFDRCLAWKSAQYRRSGVRDMFRRPQSAQLFRSLEARGALRISSFSAGDELLAVHFGGVAEGRFYSWIAAYDPAHGRYSPGRLLLEELLRERLCCRDREFDFGIGDSSYKWHYATHNRTVGPLGRPPVALRLQRTALKSARRVLTGWPGLLARARRLRLRMQERGVRL